MFICFSEINVQLICYSVSPIRIGLRVGFRLFGCLDITAKHLITTTNPKVPYKSSILLSKTLRPPKPCSGCGSESHGSQEHEQKCPAWNASCHHCNLKGHYASVCRKKETESLAALQIAYVTYNPFTDTYSLPSTEIQEISALLTAYTRDKNYNPPPTPMKIFPDSGASVCITGTTHLQ